MDPIQFLLTGEQLDEIWDDREWPRCQTCRKPAEIVCASPSWSIGGFLGADSNRRAIFVCRDHAEEPTGRWYWFWIIDADRRDDDCMTLWERDSLTHIANKTWGPPFLHWLLLTYDLSPHAERDAREGRRW